MEKQKLKIGLIGMGPVGQILAVHLQEAGCEIGVCDIDKEKMNLIRTEGIHLEGKIKKHARFNEVYTSIKDIAERNFDVLIFSVKANHVDAIVGKEESFRNGKTYVISAQNGIDVEQKLANVFGESRTLRMVVNFAGNLQAPNMVDVTFFNPPNYIGSIDDSCQDIAKWFALTLNETGLDTNFLKSFEITEKIWEKTILNSALSAVCGIANMTMKEAMDSSQTFEIVEQIIIEAVEVAKAEDIKLGDNFVKLCLRYLKKGGNHFPSLAVDLLNNRETEIDYFNGKIVEYGRKHYIKTPLNFAFTNLVKAVSQRNSSTKESKKIVSVK